MTCHSLAHHKKTADTCTPHDLWRTQFSTCKQSSTKAKPVYTPKRNYYLVWSKNIHNTCTMTKWCTQTTFSKHGTSKNFAKNKTTVRKFALFHQPTATTLSEIWNFSTPKGTVWTQTRWEETEPTPMPVEFCFEKEDRGREEELKFQHDSKSGLGQWDSTKRKWHVLLWGLCVWTVCTEFMDVHDYHQGNTSGLWARWSSECVHTALRRTRLVPCTAVQILQDRRHHDWLNIWLNQLASDLETEGAVPGHLDNLDKLKWRVCICIDLE